jgi:hypothetical protein
LNYLIQRSQVINLFIFTVAFVSLSYILLNFYTPIGGSDFWMHAGHVRYFSENIFSPVTNYDEAGTIKVRNFAPWQFLLAIMSNIFDLSTVQTMHVGSVISVALILVGLWLVSGILSTSHFASSALLITALFVIGRGFLWSEEIHIHSIFLTASFPSTVAVALSFFCFFFTNRYLNQPSLLFGLGVVLTVSLMLLIHQMVYLHFMTFLFFWVVFMATSWKQRFIVFGLFTGGVLLAMFWPYYNPIEISYAAATGIGGDSRWDGNFSEVKLKAVETSRGIFFGGENFVKTMGLAISSYALVFFIKSKIRWPLLVFALFCTFMWHFGRTFHLPTSGYRWAMPTIFALQFIFAHHLAYAFEKVASIKPRFNKVYILSCLLIAVTGMVSIYNLRTEMWRTLPQLKTDDPANYTHIQSLITLADKLEGNIDPQAVVLADHRVSYTLVGLDLNPVIFSRKYNQTNTQLLNFYNNDLSVIQQQALLKQMNVSIILVDKTKHSVELAESIKTYAKKEAEQGPFIAYKIDPSIEM